MQFGTHLSRNWGQQLAPIHQKRYTRLSGVIPQDCNINNSRLPDFHKKGIRLTWCSCFVMQPTVFSCKKIHWLYSVTATKVTNTLSNTYFANFIFSFHNHGHHPLCWSPSNVCYITVAIYNSFLSTFWSPSMTNRRSSKYTRSVLDIVQPSVWQSVT
jgi:hypothetical protein